MYGQCIKSIDREFISEDTFLWLSRGDLKWSPKLKYHAKKKHYKQKQIANAYYVNI